MGELMASILDPRFKKLAFKDDANMTQVKRAIQAEMTRKPERESNQNTSGPSTSDGTSSAKADDLWQDFDTEVMESSGYRSLETEKEV